MLIAALDNVLLWIITLITTLDKREGGEGRDGLLQSRAHEGGADGAVPETARHAVRGHAGDVEIVRDRL